MQGLRRLLLCAALFGAIATVAHLVAQEPETPPAGGRGGRGGRGGGGGARGSTREFLGLGAAPDPAAAKAGEPLYKQNCGGCHGENARGAQAPSLVRSVVVLHDEKDEEIGPVIKNGRTQAGMPAFPGLSQTDIHNIAQYLKMQVELAANRGTYGQTYASLRNQVSGDAAKGEAFFKTNCTACHSITGDLAKIAAKYPQAAQLQARFLWPATFGPQKATVTTAAGQTISGTIRQMNDFNISLIDAAGDYHSWRQGEVKVQVEDKLSGHRALLPKYSDEDMHNLTAYLVTIQ